MKIVGTGSALPQQSITNENLSKFLDTSDEWIISRTGIKERRLITTEDLLELAVKASKSAIEAANIHPSQLDYIICSNVANNFVTPAMSCILQKRLEAQCPCVDINGACVGFIFALDMAEALQKAGRANHILIICAEEPSKFCNWKERDTSVLFGDGAGAVVISQGDRLKSIRLTTTSKPEVLYYQRKMEQTPFDEGTEMQNPLVMSGRDVFKMAVASSIQDVNAVLKEAGLETSQVDWFLLHQANARIIDSIRANFSCDKEKFPLNLDKYGNTSSASIPILLDELVRTNKIKPGDNLVLSAFGAGFVSGACVLQWN
mgnify:FL=1